MKLILKIIITFLLIFVAYKFLDYKDFYRYDFKELSDTENGIFKYKATYDYQAHRNVYNEYVGKTEFLFPRQKVDKIVLLEKDKLLKTFWMKRRLKDEKINEIIGLFNNPGNFNWGETTWGPSDYDYIFKFYNNGDLVGKIDMCYHDCGMIITKPFSPNRKYGQLSPAGYNELFFIIYKLDYWK
ncbi:MAG: hypothetical protein P1P88_11080 [Bacteroidales bacterium]|nr:hypothetical protein [Bacteroidales bacterium]